MAVTVQSSGTTGHTVGTESAIATISAEGIFVSEIDLTLMASGDVLWLRAKKAMLAAGTLRTVYQVMVQFPEIAVDPVRSSIPIVLDGVATAGEWTIEQIKGTTRAFPFRVLKL